MRAVRSGDAIGEQRAFQLEEPAFYVKAAAVTAQSSIRRDHAVTRHHNRNRIAIIRHTDSPIRLGATNHTRQIGIGASFAVRNLQQGTPALELEGRATKVDWEGEFPTTAREVFIQLAHINLRGLPGLGPKDLVRFRREIAAVKFEQGQAAVRDADY